MLRSNSKVVVDPDALRAEIERRTALTELQAHPALYTALSDRERAAERKLAEWERDQDRIGRRRRLENAKKGELREQRTEAKLAKAEHQDRQWFQRALSARRRASAPEAQLARVFRRNTITARTLYSVVVFGMLWASINVQGNLVPDRNPGNPLFWLSFGIEAMFSVPLILIMIHAQTASELGEETDRGVIVLLELALLSGSIALNAGPHYFAGNIGRGAEYSAAPVMIGVAIWLHAWLARRYARLVKKTLARISSDVKAGFAQETLDVPVTSAPGDLAPLDSHHAAKCDPLALVIASAPQARTSAVREPAPTPVGKSAFADATRDANSQPKNTNGSGTPCAADAAEALRTASSPEVRGASQLAQDDAIAEATPEPAKTKSSGEPAQVGEEFARTDSAPRDGASTLPHASPSPFHRGAEPAHAGAIPQRPAPKVPSATNSAGAEHSTASVVRPLPIQQPDDSPDEFDQLAHRILSADLIKKKSPEQVAVVLRMLDQGRPHAEITRATATGYAGGIHHKTIKKIADAAEQVKVPVRAVR
ncbi:hypothetical protein [Nocardia carnea]|uniref:hypothetical protein n=1 Tax=Nocardia carnea TaxID=37328 RepID=UPI002458EFC5|nr:hypothetical protein [Nocardia carnea]